MKYFFCGWDSNLLLSVEMFNECFLFKPTALSMMLKTLNAFFIKLLDSRVLFPTGNEYISIFNLCCNCYLFLVAHLAPRRCTF